MPLKCYSILYFFLMIDVLDVCNSDATLRFKVSVYNWKTCKYPGNWFLSIKNISVQKCILECRLRARCKAVKFSLRKRACKLFDTEKTLNVQKKRKPCVIIFMSDVLDTTPFPEFCKTCSTEQRCDIQAQRCVTEECDELKPTDTEVFGNMWSVGSTVERVPSYCSHLGSYYREKARCVAGGQWEIDVATFLNWCFKIEQSIYFIAPAKTFQEGMHYCSSHGGHLIQIESEAERLRFTAYVEDNWSTDIWCWWLGMTDAEEEGTWKYSHTKTEIVYKHWKEGEPNNVYGVEHCAVIYGLYEGWLDYKCDFKCGTICESNT